MFICERCHKDANCSNGFIERMMVSWGPCEICGKTGHCLDCHGYNYAKKKEG